MKPLSRRTFLAASTSAVVLAACGNDSGGGSATANTSAGGTIDLDNVKPGKYDIGSRFAPGTHVSGVPNQRIPVVLINTSDQSAVSKGPDTFTAQLSLAGEAKGAPITFTRRQEGIPAPYWVASATFDEPGTWDILATFPDGSQAVKALSVLGPEANLIPTIGSKLVSVDTPTVASAQGVNPICTASPQCPLHSVSLSEAMAAGKPIALLIGTPAYCQTGICGPVLDLLVAEQKNYAGKIEMIHAEVYTKAYTGADTPTTLAVEQYHLTFEPYLVVADATGTIVARLDAIWDADELKSSLDLIS
ncbi:MAG: twin-arginine translocation signal domain-containing protein [Acidimicrobiia bacterium]